MDTLEAIEKLVCQARMEAAPTVDVSFRVLQRIAMDQAPARILPFTLFAGLSAAAAVIVLFLAVNSWTYLTSPMMDLFAPLQGAAIW